MSIQAMYLIIQKETSWSAILILISFLLMLSVATSNTDFICKIKTCKPNQWQMASQIIGKMPEINRFAASSSIAICGRHREWQSALALYRRISDPDLPLLHAALGALQKSDQGRVAEQLLWEFKWTNGYPDSHSLNLVLLAYRQDWKNALRVLGTVKTLMVEC
jgi:hypothetical protein